MRVKISLHLHSNEDSIDSPMICYSLYELIDKMASLDFKVMASTNHLHCDCLPEHIAYAAAKGVLLIPGTEIMIDGHRHLLILNGGPEAEQVSDFSQLADFRKRHPEAFIIAPHPNHGTGSTLTLRRLEKYGALFDAVEHSWFYHRWINPNRGAARMSAKLGLPFIATSDAHTWDFIDTDYALIELADLAVPAVFAAIRAGKFENVCRPKNLFQLAWFFIRAYAKFFLAGLKGRGKNK